VDVFINGQRKRVSCHYILQKNLILLNITHYYLKVPSKLAKKIHRVEQLRQCYGRSVMPPPVLQFQGYLTSLCETNGFLLIVEHSVVFAHEDVAKNP